MSLIFKRDKKGIPHLETPSNIFGTKMNYFQY